MNFSLLLWPIVPQRNSWKSKVFTILSRTYLLLSQITLGCSTPFCVLSLWYLLPAYVVRGKVVFTGVCLLTSAGGWGSTTFPGPGGGGGYLLPRCRWGVQYPFPGPGRGAGGTPFPGPGRGGMGAYPLPRSRGWGYPLPRSRWGAGVPPSQVQVVGGHVQVGVG